MVKQFPLENDHDKYLDDIPRSGLSAVDIFYRGENIYKNTPKYVNIYFIDLMLPIIYS